MNASPFLPGHPIGFPLLPVPDESGTLHWPTVDASVRDTIRALLMTRKGELILARTAGVGLPDYLHRPNSAITRRQLRDAIIAELSRHERRIRLDAVELAEAGDRGEELAIAITYRIKRTGTIGSVSLKMKLAG